MRKKAFCNHPCKAVCNGHGLGHKMKTVCDKKKKVVCSHPHRGKTKAYRTLKAGDKRMKVGGCCCICSAFCTDRRNKGHGEEVDKVYHGKKEVVCSDHDEDGEGDSRRDGDEEVDSDQREEEDNRSRHNRRDLRKIWPRDYQPISYGDDEVVDIRICTSFSSHSSRVLESNVRPIIRRLRLKWRLRFRRSTRRCR